MKDIESSTSYLSNSTYKNSYFCQTDSTILSRKNLKAFLNFSRNRKGNNRICFHRDPTDNFHEMLIYQRKNDFYPPKKHLLKDKSFHLLHGSMYVITFDEDGEIKGSVYLQKNEVFFCRISKGIIHMDLPFQESVHIEVTTGPFDTNDNLIASWFPNTDKQKFIEDVLKVL